MATCEVGDDASNFAYKGIAVRLDPGQGGVSRGGAWMLYDHDTLRLSAAWTGRGFIDWNGINFNGRHQVHPRIVGRVHVANPDGPGWANPENPASADPRVLGRDGRPYGPLPRPWAHYKGLYQHGDQVILAYTVGTTDVLETPGREIDPAHPDIPIFTRTLEIGPATDDLTMRVAPAKVAVSLVGEGPSQPGPSRWNDHAERPALRIIAGRQGVDVERRREGARRLRGGLGPVDIARAAHPRRPSAMAGGPQDPGGDRPG